MNKGYIYPSVYDIKNDIPVLYTKKEFTRTRSGKNWKRIPETEKTETITAVAYTKYIDIVSWNNQKNITCFWSYTKAGDIRARIITNCDAVRIDETFIFNS